MTTMTMTSKYCLSVQVGGGYAACGDILALPCVQGVTKVKEELLYILRYVREPYARQAVSFASAGDWLCQDRHGLWWIERDFN